MRSVLLYHIYPINHWRQITDFLFQELPFERIVVHVSLPEEPGIKEEVEAYFSRYPVDALLFSTNSGIGEVDAMVRFVETQSIEDFDCLTYMHCKGVTKSGNRNVWNWTRLLHYFIIKRMAECRKAFRKGYVSYGINKCVPHEGDLGFIGSRFYYAGNFVSLNLRKVDLRAAVRDRLEPTYYGLEGFWGKLSSYKDGYSAFNSGLNHYLSSVPEASYTSALGRIRYRLILAYYTARKSLKKFTSNANQ